MRIFTVSDLHIDYEHNKQWLLNISDEEYKNDILILAGDVTDNVREMSKAFAKLRNSFKEVLFIPGNHDLWVARDEDGNLNSLDKLQVVMNAACYYGIRMQPYTYGTLTIIPLYSWYDFSFGKPLQETVMKWADFMMCKWPADYSLRDITNHFLGLNEANICLKNKTVITFSHFLPRIDVMPFFIPPDRREIYPMLGSELLGRQVDRLSPDIHIYAHSHVNVNTRKGKTVYINNAFGYPYETRICKKELKLVFEVD